MSVAEVPLHEVRLGKEVSKEAEPREHGAEPEAVCFNVDNLDREKIARLGVVHVDRASEEIIVKGHREDICMRTRATDLLAGTEWRAERHDRASPYFHYRVDFWVPAVVSHAVAAF